MLLLALVAAAGLPAAKGDIYDYRGPDYCAGSKFTKLDRKLATALINRRVHRSSVSQSEKRMVTAPPPSRRRTTTCCVLPLGCTLPRLPPTLTARLMFASCTRAASPHTTPPSLADG